jgi:hypothetical protein
VPGQVRTSSPSPLWAQRQEAAETLLFIFHPETKGQFTLFPRALWTLLESISKNQSLIQKRIHLPMDPNVFEEKLSFPSFEFAG